MESRDGQVGVEHLQGEAISHVSPKHGQVIWRENGLIPRRANLVAHHNRILNVARDNVKLDVDDAALVCPRDAAEGVAEEVEAVVGAAGAAVDDLEQDV